MAKYTFLIVLLAGLCISAASALEMDGEWELRLLSTVAESAHLEGVRIDESRARIGDTLVLVLDGSSSYGQVLSIDRAAGTLELDGTSMEYAAHGDSLVVTDGHDRIAFTFTEIGSALMCSIAVQNGSGRAYAMIFEAIPSGDASFGSTSDSGDSPAAVEGGLVGATFRHESSDISLEFRSRYVEVRMGSVNAGVFKYERDGRYVYVEDPSAGTVEFEIVDAETLYTGSYGLRGYYARE